MWLHLISSPFPPVVTHLCEWDEQLHKCDFKQNQTNSNGSVPSACERTTPPASCDKTKRIRWETSSFEGWVCLHCPELERQAPAGAGFPVVSHEVAASEGVLDEHLRTCRMRKQLREVAHWGGNRDWFLTEFVAHRLEPGLSVHRFLYKTSGYRRRQAPNGC